MQKPPILCSEPYQECCTTSWPAADELCIQPFGCAVVGTRTARRGAVQRGRRQQWGQGRMAVALPRVPALCRSRSWCTGAPSCLLGLEQAVRSPAPPAPALSTAALLASQCLGVQKEGFDCCCIQMYKRHPAFTDPKPAAVGEGLQQGITARRLHALVSLLVLTLRDW